MAVKARFTHKIAPSWSAMKIALSAASRAADCNFNCASTRRFASSFKGLERAFSRKNGLKVKTKTTQAQDKIAAVCACQEERPATTMCRSPSSPAATDIATAAQRSARRKGYGVDMIRQNGRPGGVTDWGRSCIWAASFSFQAKPLIQTVLPR